MSDYSANEHPSATGAFLRGFGSNMATGALMMGTLALVALIPWFAALMPTPIGAAAIILATGLFGGVMAVKRAMFDSHEQANPTYIPVPVNGMSGPAIAPSVSADIAPDQAPAKNWVDTTGRGEDTQTRVQQILANGSMSDKDRASALLSEREAELANPVQQSRT